MSTPCLLFRVHTCQLASLPNNTALCWRHAIRLSGCQQQGYTMLDLAPPVLRSAAGGSGHEAEARLMICAARRSQRLAGRMA
jgi:hypothetical protein